VPAQALEANRQLARLAEELRAENARLREKDRSIEAAVARRECRDGESQ
jgi:hypothetical protein